MASASQESMTTSRARLLSTALTGVILPIAQLTAVTIGLGFLLSVSSR
jgi:hypothetical protein